MTLTSFTSKQLRFTLVLNQANSNGVFPGTNSNTLILADLRASVNIQTVPGIPTRASAKLYGMRQQDMNALTTIFFNSTQRIVFNNVVIEQNSGAGWTQVFSGMITEGQPRYPPNGGAFFEFAAITGYNHQIAPVPPVSFRGTVPVDTIARQLVTAMGFAYLNEGVTTNVTNFYGPGTTMDQFNRLCQQTRTQYVIAGDTVAIWPLNVYRPSVPILQLNPNTGLEGYPELERFGIVLVALFNTGLVAGGRVQVSGSAVPNANGLWSPQTIDLALESNLPGGRWHSTAQCFPVPT